MNGASEKDHLRHFSVEVLMPFYASKLPEKCASINKKFGGHVSGSKRARDPYRSKAVGGKRAPKLKRSATAPEPTKVCGGENSENLSAIAAESITLNTSRGGTLNSKNFSKRVIQLDIKSDQKKSQEDLRDAIKAVIKPNRIAVATELADSAEQRQASGSRRKSKKTMRPPLNTILVTATPKKRKEVLGPRYAERRTVSPLSHDTSTIQSDLSISAGGENSHFRTPVKLCRSLTSNDGMFNSNLERNIIDSPAGGVKLVMATPLKKQIKHPEDQGTIDDIYGALGWGFSDS
ncbi:hypothetical protein EDC01DRAFT_537703 [Geopyxis carbonaria]|nr:hypothetical protein EDC01DRAFT_537703 [Geopyxis carbonaria]